MTLGKHITIIEIFQTFIGYGLVLHTKCTLYSNIKLDISNLAFCINKLVCVCTYDICIFLKSGYNRNSVTGN